MLQSWLREAPGHLHLSTTGDGDTPSRTWTDEVIETGEKGYPDFTNARKVESWIKDKTGMREGERER